MAAQRSVELAFSTSNVFKLQNIKRWADDSLKGDLFFQHSVNEHHIPGQGAARSGQWHGSLPTPRDRLQKRLRSCRSSSTLPAGPVPCALGLTPNSAGCLGSDSPPSSRHSIRASAPGLHRLRAAEGLPLQPPCVVLNGPWGKARRAIPGDRQRVEDASRSHILLTQSPLRL